MINPTMPRTESIIPKDLFSIFLKKQRICRYTAGIIIRKVDKDEWFLSILAHPGGNQSASYDKRVEENNRYQITISDFAWLV